MLSGDEIHGFHSFRVMLDNLQKGMPRNFKNVPKVAMRRAYYFVVF